MSTVVYRQLQVLPDTKCNDAARYAYKYASADFLLGPERERPTHSFRAVPLSRRAGLHHLQHHLVLSRSYQI